MYEAGQVVPKLDKQRLVEVQFSRDLVLRRRVGAVAAEDARLTARRDTHQTEGDDRDKQRHDRRLTDGPPKVHPDPPRATSAKGARDANGSTAGEEPPGSAVGCVVKALFRADLDELRGSHVDNARRVL